MANNIDYRIVDIYKDLDRASKIDRLDDLSEEIHAIDCAAAGLGYRGEATSITLLDAARQLPTLDIGDSYQKFSSKPTPPEVVNRYRFLAAFSWIVFLYLVKSSAFRAAVEELDHAEWREFSEKIIDFSVSFECFCKTRALSWKTPIAITHHNLAFSLATQPRSHHIHNLRNSGKKPASRFRFAKDFTDLDIGPIDYHIVVPGRRSKSIQEVTTVFYHSEKVINVSQCQYDANDWVSLSRPKRWPREWAYPSNPIARRDGTCYHCERNFETALCHCELKITNPLHELRHMGPKGIGVRALEFIPRDTILCDYTGRVLPPIEDTNEGDKGLYDMSVDASKDNVQKSPYPRYIARITASQEGNWSRFLNHSCKASCKFGKLRCGQINHTIIQSTRNIVPFQEITVDYGDAYFQDPEQPCLCGETTCRYRDKKSIKKRKKKLKIIEARDQANIEEAERQEILWKKVRDKKKKKKVKKIEAAQEKKVKKIKATENLEADNAVKAYRKKLRPRRHG